MTFFHHQSPSPLHIKLEKTKLGIQNTCQKVLLARCTIWGHVFDGPLGRLVIWWLSKVGCPGLVLGWFTFVTSTHEYFWGGRIIRICIFWSLVWPNKDLLTCHITFFYPKSSPALKSKVRGHTLITLAHSCLILTKLITLFSIFSKYGVFTKLAFC